MLSQELPADPSHILPDFGACAHFRLHKKACKHRSSDCALSVAQLLLNSLLSLLSQPQIFTAMKASGFLEISADERERGALTCAVQSPSQGRLTTMV
jgi:hypothetical protein